MPLLLALLLGAVQGLTEFFPVSSSSHLKLIKMAFGHSHTPVIFDLACHLGTLGALIWYMRSEIVDLFTTRRKELLIFFFALIPLIPCYFLLSPVRSWASSSHFLGLFLIVTAVILFVGQKLRLSSTKRPLRDALLIGTLQSAALIPGISRSASTISCAQTLGWSQRESVRFSFLLAIPTIMGGNLLESFSLMRHGELKDALNFSCLIGFIAAFCVGSVVIPFAMRWLEKGNLKVFAWYCLGLGGAVTVFGLFR